MFHTLQLYSLFLFIISRRLVQIMYFISQHNLGISAKRFFFSTTGITQYIVYYMAYQEITLFSIQKNILILEEVAHYQTFSTIKVPM